MIKHEDGVITFETAEEFVRLMGRPAPDLFNPKPAIVSNEKLTIFGREIEPDHCCTYTTWSIVLGGAQLSVSWHGVHGAAGRVKFGEIDSSRYKFDTKEYARDWLESEARRIMRECLEIAGLMVASSCELLEPARVRFRDERIKAIHPGASGNKRIHRTPRAWRNGRLQHD